MSLVAAALCPHPPVLVPQIAAGAADELAGLRETCVTTVRRLVGDGVRHLWVVGAGGVTRELPVPLRSSFHPYGVPLDVCIPADQPPAPLCDLPLSLLMGVWLVSTALGDTAARVRLWSVDAAADAQTCADVGGRLAADVAGPTALLVMADGSACRGEKSPGYLDDRAEEFDADVAAAVVAANPEPLLAIDPDLADRLRCGGRAAWQVLAGVLAATGGREAWRGEAHYADAPYGVGYLVASLARVREAAL